MPKMSRRAVASAILLSAGAAMLGRPVHAAPLMQVAKDPNCGCCGAWINHMKAAGFAVEVNDTRQINALKSKLGVPSELASCHTAQVEGYVIEGHVPAKAVVRLLEQKPQARGLAVPGMPIGSPGMEIEGSPADDYDVVLFGDFGKRTFARFHGADEKNG